MENPDQLPPERRPSVLMRPELTRVMRHVGEGTVPQIVKQWCATYGDFEAFGASPAIAMSNFDEGWTRLETTEPVLVDGKKTGDPVLDNAPITS